MVGTSAVIFRVELVPTVADPLPEPVVVKYATATATSANAPSAPMAIARFLVMNLRIERCSFVRFGLDLE